MTHSYMISVRLQEPGGSVTQELYVRANMPNLGVLLRTLDASPTVTRITVCKTLAVPELAKLQKMNRKSLNISEKEITKVL